LVNNKVIYNFLSPFGVDLSEVHLKELFWTPINGRLGIISEPVSINDLVKISKPNNLTAVVLIHHGKKD